MVRGRDFLKRLRVLRGWALVGVGLTNPSPPLWTLRPCGCHLAVPRVPWMLPVTVQPTWMACGRGAGLMPTQVAVGCQGWRGQWGPHGAKKGAWRPRGLALPPLPGQNVQLDLICKKKLKKKKPKVKILKH